ncbi:hypothetical protein HYX13_05665, partial [Candidatus Woesearchaeota archaeon]|nr:hypothetical protein [Candidatus Woesearchaeota archaeon]
SNNTIYNNTFTDNSVHVFFDAGFRIQTANNTFYFNKFTSAGSSDFAQNKEHGYFENFFNKTIAYGTGTKNVGNYYDFACNLVLSDSDSDNFYDTGRDYPYNHSAARVTKSDAFGVDYAPLVPTCPVAAAEAAASSIIAATNAAGSSAAAAAGLSTSEAAGVAASAVATFQEASQALSASVSTSIGGGGVLLNLKNNGEKTIILQSSIEDSGILLNEEGIRAHLQKEGFDSKKIEEQIETIRIVEEQGIESAFGKTSSFFSKSVAEIEPSKELVRGTPLNPNLPSPEEIILLPGEELRKEIKIEGSTFLAKPKQLTIKFSVADQNGDLQIVTERETSIGGMVVAGTAVDNNADEMLLDLYAIILPDEENREYWLEFDINTPTPSEESVGITGAVIGIAGKSTLASDILGPFKVRKNNSLVIGQQYSYSDAYQGPVEIVTRIRRDNKIIAEQKFPIVFARTTGIKEGLSSWVFYMAVAALLLILLVPVVLSVSISRKKVLKDEL